MNIVDGIVSLRCMIDGIRKHVYINLGSSFNRRKLKEGLRSIRGTNEYPTSIINSHLAGCVEIEYGCSLHSCDMKTTSKGKIRLDRFVNANNLLIEAADGNVIIGSFCSIAKTAILLTGHDYNRFTTYYIKRHILQNNDPDEIKYKGKDVIIGNDVWLGYNTIILGGITIGNGAVVGAGSVVTKDIEPYAIYAGNPAKFVKWRFSSDVINTLQNSQWWMKDIDQLRILASIVDKPVKELLRNHYLFT